MDECSEWQVKYGYQKFHEFLIKIQKTHQKLPFSLSSIHDQNIIFIQISHIAKSHIAKSHIAKPSVFNMVEITAFARYNVHKTVKQLHTPQKCHSEAQALLLSGRPLVCIPVYIHKGRQALSVRL